MLSSVNTETALGEFPGAGFSFFREKHGSGD